MFKCPKLKKCTTSENVNKAVQEELPVSVLNRKQPTEHLEPNQNVTLICLRFYYTAAKKIKRENLLFIYLDKISIFVTKSIYNFLIKILLLFAEILKLEKTNNRKHAVYFFIIYFYLFHTSNTAKKTSSN